MPWTTHRRILQHANCLASPEAFSIFLRELFGDVRFDLICWQEGNPEKRSSTETKWYNRLTLSVSKLQTDATLDDEIKAVHECIKWDKILSNLQSPSRLRFIDPFSGDPRSSNPHNIEDYFKHIFPEAEFVSNDRKVKGGVNSLNPSENSELRPSTRYDKQVANVYVFSAPFLLNDIAINYFDTQSYAVLACQIRSDFLTQNATRYRQCWYQQLQKEARVVIVEGGPIPFRPKVGQLKWILIFKSAKLRSRYLQTRCEGYRYLY
jgi:hypothetical protein